MKNLIRGTLSIAVATSFVACGGGGGGSVAVSGGSSQTIYYPYQTVYGDACKTQEATPGCTFLKSNGQRIKVTADPNYNKYGQGSDNLWYVKFDSSGHASVYNDLAQFQYTAKASDFAGYIGGNTIGVGTTGFYWENISNGTYWLGKNGVLYSANTGDSNYGQAINDKTSSKASDTNFAALNSDTNKKLVKTASEKLMKDYGFKQDKAVAVASALNSWAVAAAERGTTSEKDMDKTFKAVFGVQFSDALAAAKDLAMGDNTAMQDLTNRSASELGLKPHQAQKFMKGMYKKALADWGYDETSINW
ncbi:MAG: hypothetical protein ACXVCY_03365 [Pseudobdellovibrionaceae bacterium]